MKFSAHYQSLRQLAARFLRRQRHNHTLHATALVHEAFLKLADPKKNNFASEEHFVATAAKVMRGILADYARRRNRVKRGGGRRRISLEELTGLAGDPGLDPEDYLALDEALDRLAKLDPEQARIVEMRFFAGQTALETAATLKVSLSTVERSWRAARAWLLREISKGGSDGSRKMAAS